MAQAESDMDAATLAAYHDGLAHPARVAALRELRARKRMPLADLRKAVGAAIGAIDTRTMQHHAYKMQVAGIVTIHREGGRDVVTLLRDVTLKVKPVPGV